MGPDHASRPRVAWCPPSGAQQRRHLVDASEQHGPADGCRVGVARRPSIDGGLRPRGARGRGAGWFGLGASDVRDGGPGVGERFVGGAEDLVEDLLVVLAEQAGGGAVLGGRL